MQKGLPLKRLRRSLAVDALLPLEPWWDMTCCFNEVRKMLPSRKNLDPQLVQVLVLGCEHAAPLPSNSLESLVQLCRSLWAPKGLPRGSQSFQGLTRMI